MLSENFLGPGCSQKQRQRFTLFLRLKQPSKKLKIWPQTKCGG
jgi:hypothetical protein